MKALIFIIFGFVFLVPLVANADACSDAGYTVVYVNGILMSKDGADRDRARLANLFRERTERQDVHFITGYNESHIAGLSDLVQSISQTYGRPISSFNLDEILRDIHGQIHTRKVLLLGHSQGTFYTNEMYQYLTAHGSPQGSIAVYNLATPASFVAGGGTYLTSTHDRLIQIVRDLAARGRASAPLPSNIEIIQTGDDELAIFSGHDFSKVYLAGAADRIVSDMDQALRMLSSDHVGTDRSNDCFDPPATNVLRAAESMLYGVSDPIALGVKTSATFAYDAGAIILKTTAAALTGGYRAIAAAIGFAKNPRTMLPPANTHSAAKIFPIAKESYGSTTPAASGPSLSQSDTSELSDQPSGARSPREVSDINRQNNHIESEPQSSDSPQTPPAPEDTNHSNLLRSSIKAAEHATSSQNDFVTPFLTPPQPPFYSAAGSSQSSISQALPLQNPTSNLNVQYSSVHSQSPSAVNISATSTATSTSVEFDVGTTTLGLSLITTVASTTPETIATSTVRVTSTADYTAPFRDSFDSYDFGNLYAQEFWHNNEHAWEVTDQGCMGDSGRCLVSAGINGSNWKSGADLAKGEWKLHFYVTSPFSPYYVGPNIYFGSAEHPKQTIFQIVDDLATSSASKILDNRSNVVASGVALNAWHTFDFLWDMSSTTNCTFFISVDGLSTTSAAVNVGGPSDCYSNVFSEHAIGTLGLGTYYVGQGQFLIDTIEGGPVADGCLVNCSSTTMPLTLSDSFDHFNDMGWAAPRTPNNSLHLGSFDDGSTTSTLRAAGGNCHSGGCLNADGWIGGLGGGGWSVYQYLENGIPKRNGAFTVWAKSSATSTEWSHVTGNIGLCEAKWSDCVSPWSYMFKDIVPNDGLWHQFYIAWQPNLFVSTTSGAQNSSNVEACVLQDATSSITCSWQQTSFSANRGFDGVILSGAAFRPDLGDHLWFDDLKEVSP